jgi:hypothetical protein
METKKRTLGIYSQMDDLNDFLHAWCYLYKKHSKIEVIFTNGQSKKYRDFWIVDIDTVMLEDENDDEGDTVKLKDIDELR